MSKEIYNNIKIKNNVLFGKNNWLFLYNGGQKQFDYLLGEEIVNEKSIENFTNNINKRTEIFESKNIDYLHVVFPSKPVVKKKYLPKKFNIKSVFKNYYEKPLLSNSNIIYPLSELLNLEKKQSTFHKYNTHNSGYGYLKITEIIFKELGYTINLEDFIKNTEINEVGGDLANMCLLNEKHQETIINLHSDLKTYRSLK